MKITATLALLLSSSVAVAEPIQCPEDCNTFDSECKDFECDTTTGSCYWVPKNVGLSCTTHDEHGLCFEGNVCDANGMCGSGTPKNCVHLNGLCTIGQCDKETGNCFAGPKSAGETCTTGSTCVENETCNAVGVCEGSPVVCLGKSVCNDEKCIEGQGCVSNFLTGTQCDDGDACTTDTYCTATGTCEGTVLDCSSGNTDCSVSECVGGQCVLTPINVGGRCDDNDGCTENDMCTAEGTCVGTASTCDELTDQCNVGVCKNHKCGKEPKVGFSCKGSDPCTTGETCDAFGSCVGGSVKDCSGLDDQCSVGMCDRAGECYDQPHADGTVCDDKDPCTVGDSCKAGVCVSGAPKVCEDEGPCKQGSCGADGSCTQTPKVGFSCDDSDKCTYTDTCTADGVCVGTPLDCSRLTSDCATGTCMPNTGVCEAVPKDGMLGQSCTAGDACTVDAKCGSDGMCTGSPMDCTASGDQCNDAKCVAGACSTTPKVGWSCDDESPCTEGDVCSEAGVCAGVAKDCAWAGDSCSNGVCEATSGTCIAESNGDPGCVVTPPTCAAPTPILDPATNTCVGCLWGSPDGAGGGCTCLSYSCHNSIGQCGLQKQYDADGNYVCPDLVRRNLRGVN